VTVGLIAVDVSIFLCVPFLALWLRFNGEYMDSPYFGIVVGHLPVIVTIQLIVFGMLRIYSRLWRYSRLHDIGIVIGNVTVATAAVHGYFSLLGITLPTTVLVLIWLLSICLIGFSRLMIRIAYLVVSKWRLTRSPKRWCGEEKKILIYGAGDSGALIAGEIQERDMRTQRIVGFIDDDPDKWGQYLMGIKILGSGRILASTIKELGVDEIIIAMPSVDGVVVRSIVEQCRAIGGCDVKTVPGLYELINGEVSVEQIRNVQVEDLLRREPVKLDQDRISSYLAGKRVLVTGAGGSIGSELCRQIIRMGPSSLTLLGRGENSIYEIDNELKAKSQDVAIDAVIADVRDRYRMEMVFSRVRPQVVFHAAAHKHVPLMERQPVEAVCNNIFGTKNVAEAADRYKTETFVMISTDKAVNPTSVMGASKRVAEMVIQNMNSTSATKFVAVRFGNVLGSRGSVIPLFKKQIAAGGPITVTHPEMVRYFMTIPEAAMLVLQAGSMAQGGEVFVLDMGDPVKIVEMARDLIQLSGLVPDVDIKLEFPGLRPGEKLYEELLTAEEGTAATKHQKIFTANLNRVDPGKLQHGLALLLSEAEPKEIITILTSLVPTYMSEQVRCGENEGKISRNRVETQMGIGENVTGAV